jgi:hypothetical protein
VRIGESGDPRREGKADVADQRGSRVVGVWNWRIFSLAVVAFSPAFLTGLWATHAARDRIKPTWAGIRLGSRCREGLGRGGGYIQEWVKDPGVLDGEKL